MRLAAVNLNGISIAYAIGFVNATMALVASFGISLDPTQRAAIVVFVNSALVLAIHLAHRVGEAATNDAAHELAKTKMDKAATATEPV